MRTNREKYIYYLNKIKERDISFIDGVLKGIVIPEVLYRVYPMGKISAVRVVGIHYYHRELHYYHKGLNIYGFYEDKYISRKEVKDLKDFYDNIDSVVYDLSHVFVDYEETYGDGYVAKSFFKLVDVLGRNGIYDNIGEAVIDSEVKIEENNRMREYREKYSNEGVIGALGFDFLGWQNGWESEYYDEDGNLCSESGKERKSFGYSGDKYPRYRKCIDSGHVRINEQKTRSGSENLVVCPECKIYWKYDCSG